MGATIYQGGYTYTVHDTDHLPEGVYPDDVCDKVSTVVREAIWKWYENEGGELLACGPDC